MSPKILSLAAGWTFLGLFGPATVVAGPPQSPDAPAASPAPSGPPTVLLLSSGKVLQGEILKNETGYVVRHKIGTIHKSRREVVGTFATMEDVYRYKVSILPRDDPDEVLKLAEWCLDQKMKPEAKTQLEAALALNPEDRRARVLLANLGQKPALANDKDPDLVRTAAEVGGEAPGALNLAQIRERYHRDPKPAGPPVVLDLPPALAVRRFQEFERTVHPILQNRCAKCHNEQFQGDFQMVKAGARRDYGNDLLLRTNLDATLRLINPDDLARSTLLSASGMTHGPGGKPVLGGPNNPEFQALAAWVKGLKVDGAKSPASAPGNGPSPPKTEGFATSRLGSGVDPAMPPAVRPSADKPRVPRMSSAPNSMLVENNGVVEEEAFEPTPAGSLIPGSESGTPSNPPPASEFPTSPLLGGPNPAKIPVRGARPTTKGGPADPRVVKAGGDDKATYKTMPDGSEIKTLPDGSSWIKVGNEYLPFVVVDPKDAKKTPSTTKKKLPPKELNEFITNQRAG